MNLKLVGKKTGFTLIELLVVIAIMSTLMAMLLPAIQKVREAAAKIRCSNNLKQLGIAAHAYHNNRDRFPPGVMIPYGRHGNQLPNSDMRFPFGPNWAVLLLPFLEQTGLYQEMNVKGYPGVNYGEWPSSYTDSNAVSRWAQWMSPPPQTGSAPAAGQGPNQDWRGVRGNKLAVMVCPSDRGHDVLYTPTPDHGPKETGWARGNYAANAGAEKFDDTWPTENYFGGLGVLLPNQSVKLGQLTSQDGSSNTIMFNEVRVGVSAKDMRGTWALGFPGASITAGNGKYVQGEAESTFTPNDFNDESDEIQGCDDFYKMGIGSEQGMGCKDLKDSLGGSAGPVSGNVNFPTSIDAYNEIGQARSRHPGGVLTCFADGSVRFVRNDVQAGIWRSMLTSNGAGDGEGHGEISPYHYEF